MAIPEKQSIRAVGNFRVFDWELLVIYILELKSLNSSENLSKTIFSCQHSVIIFERHMVISGGGEVWWWRGHRRTGISTSTKDKRPEGAPGKGMSHFLKDYLSYHMFIVPAFIH